MDIYIYIFYDKNGKRIGSPVCFAEPELVAGKVK